MRWHLRVLDKKNIYGPPFAIFYHSLQASSEMMRCSGDLSDHVHTLTSLAPHHAAQWVSQHLVQGHDNGLLVACNLANLEAKNTKLIRDKVTEHIPFPTKIYGNIVCSHSEFHFPLPSRILSVRRDLGYGDAISKLMAKRRAFFFTTAGYWPSLGLNA